MANSETFTSDRTVTTGNPTKKLDHDELANNTDYLEEALATIMSPSASDGVITQTYVVAAAAATKVLIDSNWDPASGTPANNQAVRWRVRMSDSANNQDVVGALDWVQTDVTSASEDLRLDFLVITAGTLAAELSLTGAALYPSTNDGLALGIQSTNEWSDADFASGAVIGFANRDVVFTHSTNLLVFSGGNFAVVPNTGNYSEQLRVSGNAPNANSDDVLLGLNVYNSAGTATRVNTGRSAWGINTRSSQTNDTFGFLSITYWPYGGGSSLDCVTFAPSSATAIDSSFNSGPVKNAIDNAGFYTGAGDDVRIYHDGTNSFITNITGYLDVTGTFLASAGLRIGANAANNLIDDASGGTGSTTLYIGNASITVSSDVRAKLNISPWDGDALSLVRQARVVEFDYDRRAINDESPWGPSSRGHYVGLTAQDVIDWAPWAVNAGDAITCQTCRAGLNCDEHAHMWKMEHAHLVGVLFRAIQQLESEVQTLKGMN